MAKSSPKIQLPPASIAGLRKVVIHEYFKINPDLIRDVVDNDLAAMAQSLRDGLRALARNESEAANAVIDESTSEIRAGTHQNVLLVLCPQGVWLLLLGVPAGEVSWTGDRCRWLPSSTRLPVEQSKVDRIDSTRRHGRPVAGGRRMLRLLIMTLFCSGRTSYQRHNSKVNPG